MPVDVKPNRPKMFSGDFGFKKSQQEIEQTVLKKEDYNLPDVFSRGQLFTAFNSIDVNKFLKIRDEPLDLIPSIMNDRAYERCLLSHPEPHYLTPCTSPLAVALMDAKLKRKMLTSLPETDELARNLANLKDTRKTKNRRRESTSCPNSPLGGTSDDSILSSWSVGGYQVPLVEKLRDAVNDLAFERRNSLSDGDEEMDSIETSPSCLIMKQKKTK